MRKWFPLLLCLVFLLTGCAQAELTQPAPSAGAQEAPIPAEKKAPFEDDYKALWDALENSYPYLPYLAEQGLDVHGIYDRYALALPSVTDEGAFYGMLRRMLAELKNFAHLDVVSPEMYRSYYSIYVLGDVVSEEYSRPFAEILQDARLSGRYQPPASPDSGGQHPGTSRYPDVAVQYFPNCKTLYLQIPSFAQELVERDRDIVYDALARYPESEHIIFDITGNSGGSDYYWMHNLVAPFGGRHEFSFRTFFKSSPLVKKYYGAVLSSPVSDLDDAPAWVEKMGLDRFFVSELVLPDPSAPRETLPGGIDRWLLISENVFSASDKFAGFCKATGWATVVGTRTAGDGLGSAPILLLLPDSGLLIRFSSMAGENPDGSINAVAGTNPDAVCPGGELPLNRCLELIRGE